MISRICDICQAAIPERIMAIRIDRFDGYKNGNGGPNDELDFCVTHTEAFENALKQISEGREVGDQT